LERVGEYFTGKNFYPLLELSDFSDVNEVNWPGRCKKKCEDVQVYYGHILMEQKI
jgi:hypothetical protein